MTTKEKILNALEALGDDATYYVKQNGDISVTFEDFEGFDDDWDEIEREYDDAEAVKNFQTLLAEESNSIDDNYYTTYHFDGFSVKVGYASYDI